jgi:hypothetical protein
MEPFKPRHGGGNGPESIIEAQIRDMLHRRGWHTEKLHGNKYQHGLPDLLCGAKGHGLRLIEVKDPRRKGEPFTKAQLAKFPKLSAHGLPIHVLTGASDDDYAKLMSPENWYHFLAVMRGRFL